MRASDFRAYVERKPVAPRRIVVPEPPIDPDQERQDTLMVSLGLVPGDPEEVRAFELRLARMRAAGGERAEALAGAERELIEDQEREKVRLERAAKRAAKRAQKKR